MLVSVLFAISAISATFHVVAGAMVNDTRDILKFEENFPNNIFILDAEKHLELLQESLQNTEDDMKTTEIIEAHRKSIEQVINKYQQRYTNLSRILQVVESSTESIVRDLVDKIIDLQASGADSILIATEEAKLVTAVGKFVIVGYCHAGVIGTGVSINGLAASFLILTQKVLIPFSSRVLVPPDLDDGSASQVRLDGARLNLQTGRQILLSLRPELTMKFAGDEQQQVFEKAAASYGIAIDLYQDLPKGMNAVRKDLFENCLEVDIRNWENGNLQDESRTQNKFRDVVWNKLRMFMWTLIGWIEVEEEELTHIFLLDDPEVNSFIDRSLEGVADVLILIRHMEQYFKYKSISDCAICISRREFRNEMAKEVGQPTEKLRRQIKFHMETNVALWKYSLAMGILIHRFFPFGYHYHHFTYRGFKIPNELIEKDDAMSARFASDFASGFVRMVLDKEIYEEVLAPQNWTNMTVNLDSEYRIMDLGAIIYGPFHEGGHFTGAFYEWKHAKWGHEIDKLLSGEEITLPAIRNFLVQQTRSAVQITSVGICLLLRDGNDKWEVQDLLVQNSMPVYLTSHGDSYYFVDEKYYFIGGTRTQIYYQMYDRVFSWPPNKSLSPYTTWSISFVRIDFVINLLKQYRGRDVDLYLIGQGSMFYNYPWSSHSEWELDKYYKGEKYRVNIP